MRPPSKLPSFFLFVLLAIALPAVLLTGCVVDGSSTAGGQPSDEASVVTSSTLVPRTTGVPTMRPTPAEELGIVLDDDGRPFDNYRGPDGSSTEQRLLARLQADQGLMEVVDGDALYQPLLVTVSDTESVRFASATELDLRIVWQQRPAPPDPEQASDPEQERVPAADDGTRFYPVGDAPGSDLVEAILGVRISTPGATVARWGRFEPAYESDDGLGAVISRAALQWADKNLEFGEPLLTDELPADRPYLLADLDQEEGFDLFVFDNGGDPEVQVLTEGFNEDDELVAIMLWHPRFPWRLAVPDGSPPPDVDEREQELIDCIEGRRLIDRWGRCT